MMRLQPFRTIARTFTATVLAALVMFPVAALAQTPRYSVRNLGTLIKSTETDRVGAMTRTLNTLAAAKINVTAMDALAGGGKFAAIFWVKPKKVAKTAKLLRAR